MKKNQLVNVARGENVLALRTEEYFAERAAQRCLKKALQVLKRAGKAIHRFLVTNLSQRGPSSPLVHPNHEVPPPSAPIGKLCHGWYSEAIVARPECQPGTSA